MKNIFTFILVLFTFIIHAQSPTSIRVKTSLPCEKEFDKQTTVQLYERIGNDYLLLETKEGVDVTFNNVNKFSKYQVRMNSLDTTESKLTIKDLHLLRKHILGFKNISEAPGLAIGDVNNGNVTTFDMVLQIRHLVGISLLKLNYWVFVEKSKTLKDASGTFLQNAHNIDNLPNSENVVEFIAYQKGKSSTAAYNYCDSCPTDTTSYVKINGGFTKFKKDEKYSIPISINSNKLIESYSFSLMYKDIDILFIESQSTDSNPSFYHVKNSKSINFANLLNSPSTSSGITLITFIANKDGNFNDFFEVNTNYFNEALYEENQCVKNVFQIKKSGTECKIVWPLDIIIPSCDLTKYQTGKPEILGDCKDITSVTYSDTKIDIVGSGNNQCKIIRKWSVINWITSELFEHFQIIKSNQNDALACVNTTVVFPAFQNSFVEIWAIDLVKNSSPNYIYSFSPTNPTEKSKKLNILPNPEFVTVYNHTDTTFCIAEITKIGGNNNDCSIVWPPDVTHDCDDTTIDTGKPIWKGNCQFQLAPVYTDQDIVIVPNQEIKTLRTWVAYNPTTQETFTHVQIIICKKGIATPPLELFCFDDELLKEEKYVLPIFSTNFDEIIAIQGAFKMKNALITDAIPKELSKVAFNKQLYDTRFVWVSENGTAESFRIEDTLFVIKMTATKDVSITDMISLANDLLESEAVLNDLNSTKIKFGFKVVKRSVASKDLIKQNISIYPNPSNGDIVNINADFDSEVKVSFHTTDGQKVFERQMNFTKGPNRLDLPFEMFSGMYIVKVENDNASWFRKVMIVK